MQLTENLRINDIHTYKEIVAFTEGKGLDEIKRFVENNNEAPHHRRISSGGEPSCAYGVMRQHRCSQLISVPR